MRNFKVEICYDGSRYHGYQFQINALSIQEVLEKAVCTVLNEQVRISGCSRTDTGVHAEQYFFSVLHNSRISCNGFTKAMNTMLPKDIAVLNCEEVSEDFHARFSSKGKKYIYKIWNGSVRNPFYEKRALMYPYTLDEDKLRECADLFIGRHDFTSFCSTASAVEDKVRTVYRIDVERNGDMVEVSFIGEGFLHNMVRIMVGTMLFYNEGKFTLNDIKDMLEVPDRTKAGKTASPDGLYLYRVYYDNEIEKDLTDGRT